MIQRAKTQEHFFLSFTTTPGKNFGKFGLSQKDQKDFYIGGGGL